LTSSHWTTSEAVIEIETAEALPRKVARLWRETLGRDADTEVSFIAAGGDSYLAVILAIHIHQETAFEVDYLDILQAKDVGDIVRAIETLDR
jgi:acyl carrier protein